jgi:hypothetical protein
MRRERVVIVGFVWIYDFPERASYTAAVTRLTRFSRYEATNGTVNGFTPTGAGIVVVVAGTIVVVDVVAKNVRNASTPVVGVARSPVTQRAPSATMPSRPPGNASPEHKKENPSTTTARSTHRALSKSEDESADHLET